MDRIVPKLALVLLVLIQACQTQAPTAILTPGSLTPEAQAPSETRAADQSIYFVDGTGGRDSNSGTSRGEAWRTVQKAADTLAAGEVCVVLAGQYDERVHVTTSGRPGAPITYLAEGEVVNKGFTVEADYIVVKGFAVTNTEDHWREGVGIYVKGSHCVIEDNAVTWATRGGIVIAAEPADSATTSGCIVRNNRLSRNAHEGIRVEGRGHLVEGNDISGTIQIHPLWKDPPDWADADGMRVFGSGHVIRKNNIHDISYADAENVDPHIDCFQSWGPLYDVVFEQNSCSVPEFQVPEEAGQGFMLERQNAPLRNLTIRNNAVTAFRHVQLLDGENVTIVHNTFAGAEALLAHNSSSISLTRSDNTTILNNVIYNARRYLNADPRSQRSLTIGYNCVYRQGGQPPAGEAFAHDVWNQDPRLVNAAAGDLGLQPSSPCIDAGVNAGVDVDFAQVPRPQHDGYDIGAFEYQGPLPPLPDLTSGDRQPN